MCAHINAYDGGVGMLACSGGAQGDGNAPDEFLCSFHNDAIGPWLQDTKSVDMPFQTQHPFNNTLHDASTSTFMDDIFKMYIIFSHGAKTAIYDIRNTNNALDRR